MMCNGLMVLYNKRQTMRVLVALLGRFSWFVEILKQMAVKDCQNGKPLMLSSVCDLNNYDEKITSVYTHAVTIIAHVLHRLIFCGYS